MNAISPRFNRNVYLLITAQLSPLLSTMYRNIWVSKPLDFLQFSHHSRSSNCLSRTEDFFRWRWAQSFRITTAISAAWQQHDPEYCKRLRESTYWLVRGLNAWISMSTFFFLSLRLRYYLLKILQFYYSDGLNLSPEAQPPLNRTIQNFLEAYLDKYTGRYNVTNLT